MNKLIIAIGCCLMSFVTLHAQDLPDTAPAAQQYYFGYLSYDAVLKSMPAYSSAQKTIATLRTQYQKELERSEAQFTKLFSEYVDGQKSFPENIMLKRQKELQMQLEQSLQFKAEAKALLEKAEADAMAPANNALNEALRKIGQKKGYAFILNTDNNNCPFINSEMGEDITEEAKAAVAK